MHQSFAPHLLDAALRARVILAIGSRDCGKTTFVTHLANELFRQGYSVGAIDSDVGQSDIGPPTTIGFGTVKSELNALGDVDVRKLYFVGSVTPRGHLPAMLLGSRKLLDRALAGGLQKILIDTTGFISGQAGRILKQQKIQALEPDLLICLQAQQECEHILKAYASQSRPEILRLSPSEDCRNKSHPVRQKYRRAAFQKYFVPARELDLSFSEIGIFGSNLFSGRPLSPQEQNDISQILSGTQKTGTSQSSNSATPQNVVVHTPPFHKGEAGEILPGSAGKSPLTPLYERGKLNGYPQICWGEWIGDELFLVTDQELQRRQILTLKKSLAAIRYIHNSSLREFQHLLLGLLDAQGECLGLGILKSIDFNTKQALIFTPVEQHVLKAVQFSSYHVENAGDGKAG